MSWRERAVAAAAAAVGTRFRLHGRDPQYGLDCVGLAGLAMRAAGFEGNIPCGYALRGGVAADFVALIDGEPLVRTARPEPGDVMLFAIDAMQFHVAVLTPGGFTHADAMLGRVVERPGPPPWPMIAAWTLIDD
jgi:cell wall-associated NlpC family hydrolase